MHVPGGAHLLEGASPLWARQRETISRTARASAARRGLKEAAGKMPAWRTGITYEAAMSDKKAHIFKVQ